MSLKFCSVCKKIVDKKKLNHWAINDQEGYICNECLKDIQHFIQENTMPEWLIWQNLEHWDINCIQIGIDYLDELPRTKETLDRLGKLKITNSYLQADVNEFIEELEISLR
jgi:hypothetical protein